MSTPAELRESLGPVRRWREGDILFAENNFISAAFVVTSDPDKVGKLGWHGPKQICVEYIELSKGALWDK